MFANVRDISLLVGNELNQAAGTKDPDAVMAKMREIPVDDFMTHGGKLRADGRLMREMHMFEVKKPSESKGDWDLYRLARTVPGADAFRAIDKGNCPLVTGAVAPK